MKPRFIPAWAGNTPAGDDIFILRRVHPRVGGEHAVSVRRCSPKVGSSPRGRGTRRNRSIDRRRRRFIPAWAGNTKSPSKAGRLHAVHPRVGGEHGGHECTALERHGSSPRGRGTPQLGREVWRRIRFIPAWAGNTPKAKNPTLTAAVHPRVGGEHLVREHCRRNDLGSSPRGRGTLSNPGDVVLIIRFIPAWAGNTAAPSTATSSGSVHPRVGGEHPAGTPQATA